MFRPITCALTLTLAATLGPGCPEDETPTTPVADAADAAGDAGDVGGGDVTSSDAGPTPTVDPPEELGPYTVGHVQFDEVDAARGDRPLKVDIWYPVDAADFDAATDPQQTGYLLSGVFTLPSENAFDDLPVSARTGQTLIVFSHGYGGINTQSVLLVETLASHGFIVIAPEHTGNAQGAGPADDYDTAAGNRVPDVSFVIDRMFARNQDATDPFFGRLDETAVGVTGHSFGGMTSIGMACGWAGAGPDSRVTAIAPISAVIQGDLQRSNRTGPNTGFSAQQLGTITVPVMLLGGTADVAVPVENNDIAYAGLTAAPAVYKATIDGANHTHFANVCDIGNLLIDAGITQDQWEGLGAGDLIAPYNATCTPDVFPIEEATRLQSLYVVAFFNKHMLGETGYDQYLTGAYADTEPAVTFERKELP